MHKVLLPEFKMNTHNHMMSHVFLQHRNSKFFEDRHRRVAKTRIDHWCSPRCTSCEKKVFKWLLFPADLVKKIMVKISEYHKSTELQCFQTYFSAMTLGLLLKGLVKDITLTSWNHTSVAFGFPGNIAILPPGHHW